MVIKPGDLVHQNTHGPKGSKVVSVLFKEAFFEEKEDVKIEDWQWLHGLPNASIAFQFAQDLEDITDEEELYELLIELFAELSFRSIATSSSIPQWLSRVEEKIKDDYRMPIQTKALADWTGTHPVYLARVFRKHYGLSIKSFLQKIRLERVLEELSDGAKSLVEIALDTGFSDQSHLNRVFRKNFQTSPGVFRKWVCSE